MGTRVLLTSLLAAIAHHGAASAEVTGSEGDGCESGTVGECLAKPGCRWFSYAGHCELCDEWFGREQAGLVGCRRRDPQEYCEHIVSTAQQKSESGVDMSGAPFRDAVGHYQVVQRSGAVGDPHQRTSGCTVWCDRSTSPRQCAAQVQVQNAVRGTNYGGRFIPEKFLGLPGFNDLFLGATRAPGAHQLSLCDINSSDAGVRMEAFLDRNIKRDQFASMAELGFNVVRLPLGYWNLVDVSASPHGPEDAVRRWTQLQNILPARQYAKWIEKVFDYAKAANLMVLMELHGAPGGQSGNQNTGCDSGYDFLFGTEQTTRLGLEAVDAMARICAAKGESCYGIELVNEPYGPVAHVDPDPAIIMVRKLNSGGMGRPFLADFYKRAVRAARKHMEHTKPIVLMDWPDWLQAYWMYNTNAFSYAEHGRLVFSTHLYKYTHKPLTEQGAARASFGRDMDVIQQFSSYTGFDVLISEYSLSNHGSGFGTDPFDYDGFTDWFVHKMGQIGVGSMVWNYDAYWPAWGPLFKPTVGKTLVDWKRIWGTSPAPQPALPPPPMPPVTSQPTARPAGGGDRPTRLSSFRSDVERTMSTTMSTASLVLAAVSIASLAVLGFALAWSRSLPHLGDSKYQTLGPKNSDLCGERCDTWCDELLADAELPKAAMLEP